MHHFRACALRTAGASTYSPANAGRRGNGGPTSTSSTRSPHRRAGPMARPTLLLRARAQGRDTVRRLVAGIAMIAFLIGAAPVSAAGQGVQPPNAKVHNHTLTDLAAAWALWAFGSPEDENPLLASRCEQSPIDPKIWFLPASLGGDMVIDCQIPKGSFLVLTPAGFECSGADGVGMTEA